MLARLAHFGSSRCLTLIDPNAPRARDAAVRLAQLPERKEGSHVARHQEVCVGRCVQIRCDHGGNSPKHQDSPTSLCVVQQEAWPTCLQICQVRAQTVESHQRCRGVCGTPATSPSPAVHMHVDDVAEGAEEINGHCLGVLHNPQDLSSPRLQMATPEDKNQL